MQIDAPDLTQSEYSQQELDRLVRIHDKLTVADVLKRRFRFTIDDCPTELDDALINGAGVSSAAIESENADEVRDLRTKLGLVEYENINYPRVIRRILGLERWPRHV